MRQVLLLPLLLFGTLLCSCVPASAQGPAGVGAGKQSAHTSGVSHEFSDWQVAVGYQFGRVNLLGTPFDTNGLNVSAVRYFGRWFGAESQVGFGFGNTRATTAPPNLTAKSIFAGGGPRLELRGHGRIQPFAHAIVGIEHFRFSQTAGVLGGNSALAGVGGGGMDFRLNRRTSFRAEGDWVGSRFFSTNQRSFQLVTALVVNF